MLHAQTKIRSSKWDAENSLGFWDVNGSPLSRQKTKPRINLQEEQKLSMGGFFHYSRPECENKRILGSCLRAGKVVEHVSHCDIKCSFCHKGD